MDWLDEFFDESNPPEEAPMDSADTFSKTTLEQLPEPEPVGEAEVDTTDLQAAPEPVEPEEISEAPGDDLPAPEFQAPVSPENPELVAPPEDPISAPEDPTDAMALEDVPPPQDPADVEFEPQTEPQQLSDDESLLRQADEWVGKHSEYQPSEAEKQEMGADARREMEDAIEAAIQEAVDPTRFV